MESAVPVLYGRLGEGEAMTQPSAIGVCLMLSALSLYRTIFNASCIVYHVLVQDSAEPSGGRAIECGNLNLIWLLGISLLRLGLTGRHQAPRPFPILFILYNSI